MNQKETFLRLFRRPIPNWDIFPSFFLCCGGGLKIPAPSHPLFAASAGAREEKWQRTRTLHNHFRLPLMGHSSASSPFGWRGGGLLYIIY